MNGSAIALLGWLLQTATMPATDEQGPRYENVRCRLALSLPQGWTVAEIKAPFHPTSCAFGLRPDDWKKASRRATCSASDYAVYVSVYPGRLETAKTGVLVREQGRWIIEGRAGAQNQGRVVKHALGRAIRGTSEVGCYGRRSKTYEGSAEADVAYVEVGGRVVELVADVNLTLAAKNPFDAIVRSLGVVAPAAPR